MATRTLQKDMETLSPSDTRVVSLPNTPVSVVLPPVVDGQSHGRLAGVLNGHALTIRVTGNGDLTVLDSHQQPVAVVASGTSKSFTSEGNEAGNRWIVR